MFAILLLLALALLMITVVIRRAAPIGAAAGLGVVTWTATSDTFATGAASLAALVVVAAALDTAMESKSTAMRNVALAIEILAGTACAVMLAIMLTGGSHSVERISVAAASAAIIAFIIIARRRLSH